MCAREVGVDLLRFERAVVDRQAEAPVAPDHERRHRERRERQRHVARQEDGGHDGERHGGDRRADRHVHDAPRAECVGGQAVDRVALRAAAVIGQPERLELAEEVVADPRRAAIVEVVVDHHAGHPGEIADEVQHHADEHEADHLADLAVRHQRQEEAVHPVAFRLRRQHAVDEDRERPCLEQADRDRHPDEADEQRDPRPIGREIGDRAAVDGHVRCPRPRG